MEDIYDLVKNIDTVYNSNTSFQVLKDFERVLDELDLYVYKNWEEGELFKGPDISRHWVTCTFMWPKGSMPDPVGGKRLADYDCKIRYIQTHITVPRKIRKPDDMRPYTKKGKLDTMPIWLVEIVMPKKLIFINQLITKNMKTTRQMPKFLFANVAEHCLHVWVGVVSTRY